MVSKKLYHDSLLPTPYSLLPFCNLLRFHVVSGQHPLVADVELSAGHDRIRPTILALVGNREAPLFDIGVRVRLGQSDNLFFAQQEEHTTLFSQLVEFFQQGKTEKDIVKILKLGTKGGNALRTIRRELAAAREAASDLIPDFDWTALIDEEVSEA